MSAYPGAQKKQKDKKKKKSKKIDGGEMNPYDQPPGYSEVAAGGSDHLANMLTQYPHLRCKQELQLAELFFSCEWNNRYQILTPDGLLALYAWERTGCFERQCFKGNRRFNMNIYADDPCGDENAPALLCVRRVWENPCTCLYYPKVKIEYPDGTLVGSIQYQFSCCDQKFYISDESGSDIYEIRGPCCMCQNCICDGDLDFVILDFQGNNYGRVAKEWIGCCNEMGNVTQFIVELEQSMPVEHKKIIIGAMFLIDFMFFEVTNNSN